MPQLAHSAKSTVSQFAGTLGLTARENADGSYGFDFSESGRLSVTPDADGRRILVSLTRRTILDGFVAYARFAAEAGVLPDGRVVQVGLTSTEQPVLVIGMEENAFDVPSLDRALTDMRAIFDQIGF